MKWQAAIKRFLADPLEAEWFRQAILGTASVWDLWDSDGKLQPLLFCAVECDNTSHNNGNVIVLVMLFISSLDDVEIQSDDESQIFVGAPLAVWDDEKMSFERIRHEDLLVNHHEFTCTRCRCLAPPTEDDSVFHFNLSGQRWCLQCWNCQEGHEEKKEEWFVPTIYIGCNSYKMPLVKAMVWLPRLSCD